jgi:hypothetical protein
MAGRGAATRCAVSPSVARRGTARAAPRRGVRQILTRLDQVRRQVQHQRYSRAGELGHELPLAGPTRPRHPAPRADPLWPYRLMHRHPPHHPSGSLEGEGTAADTRPNHSQGRRQPLPPDTHQPGDLPQANRRGPAAEPTNQPRAPQRPSGHQPGHFHDPGAFRRVHYRGTV